MASYIISQGCYLVKNSDNTYSVSDYEIGYGTAVEIPASYNGKPVTKILGAFSGQTTIVSVSVPASIEVIDDYSFEGCISLRDVTFATGSKLTSLGMNAFYNCRSLIKIVIPDSVISIGDNAFWGCASLTNVTIGNNVKNIGISAFTDCTSLKNIVIPDSVTNIDVWAFGGCYNLESITIGSNVATISTEAFYQCEKLKTVYYHNKNRNITDYSLYASDWSQIVFGSEDANPLCVGANLWVYDYTQNKYQLLTTAHIKDLPKYNGGRPRISWWAFAYCTSINKVIVENADIWDYAFYFCYHIKNITLKGVELIGEGAFEVAEGVSNLEYIQMLPADTSLKEIKIGAFNQQSKLKKVYYDKTPSYWSSIVIAEHNTELNNANTYYYSKKLPDDDIDSVFDYWHLDSAGNLVVWDLSVKNIKSYCSIEFDDEWSNFSVGDEDVDCHWKYNRFFYLTWDIYSGNLLDTTTGAISLGPSYYGFTDREIYYQIGNSDENEIRLYSNAFETGGLGNCSTVDWAEFPFATRYRRKLERFWYPLKYTGLIDELIRQRDAEGNVKIKIRTKITDDCGTVTESNTTLNYHLDLPPKPVENLKITAVGNNPGEFLCSWDKVGVYDSDIDAVHGYCIEMLHEPANGEYTKITGLAWDETAPTGMFKLVKSETRLEKLEIPKALDGEDPIQSFVAQYNSSNISIIDSETYINSPSNPEVYISNPNVKEFYFTPKKLGIAPGDRYKIIIYPYTTYGTFCTYNDAGYIIGFEPGTLLTNEGTASENTTSKGIVRVKTNNGWVDGQVYVKTSNSWKEAEAIYTKTEDGWKEAQ